MNRKFLLKTILIVGLNILGVDLAFSTYKVPLYNWSDLDAAVTVKVAKCAAKKEHKFVVLGNTAEDPGPHPTKYSPKISQFCFIVSVDADCVDKKIKTCPFKGRGWHNSGGAGCHEFAIHSDYTIHKGDPCKDVK